MAYRKYGRSTRAGQRRKTARRAYRRRSVSGVGKIDVNSIAGLMAGGVGAKFIDSAPFVSTLDPKIQSAIKIALGIAAPQFVKGAFVRGVSDALVAAGAADLASDFGLVSGIGKYLPSIYSNDVPVINATATAKSRAGQLDELRGATMTFSDADVPTIAGISELYD